MTKGKIREQLFCLLFSLEFHPVETWEDEMEMYFQTQENISEEVQQRLISEVKDMVKHLPELDQMIRDQAKGWSLERITVVDRVMLRLAFYEILYVEDVPVAVSINEAVELVKRYGTDKSSGFVNGILGAWYRAHSDEVSENEDTSKNILTEDEDVEMPDSKEE